VGTSSSTKNTVADDMLPNSRSTRREGATCRLIQAHELPRLLITRRPAGEDAVADVGALEALRRHEAIGRSVIIAAPIRRTSAGQRTRAPAGYWSPWRVMLERKRVRCSTMLGPSPSASATAPAPSANRVPPHSPAGRQVVGGRADLHRDHERDAEGARWFAARWRATIALAQPVSPIRAARRGGRAAR
jgi:hypothetical protein